MNGDILPIDRKAGFPIDFIHDGQTYRVIAQCECAAERMTIIDVPHLSDKAGERTVLIHYVQHGDLISLALAQRAERVNKAIFAWAEQQHRKDKRVAWGMYLGGQR